MFKGKPLFAGRGRSIPRSAIGLPVPHDAFDPPPPGSPTWNRVRTYFHPEISKGLTLYYQTPMTSLDRAKKADDSRSVSEYGGFTSSIYLGYPKVYDEGQFSRQREGSTIHFAPSPPPIPVHFAPAPSPTPIHSKHVGWAVSSEGRSDEPFLAGRQAVSGYGFI